MKRVLSALVIVAVIVVGFLGGRWYLYVSNTNSPYDEVGIELNRYMPEPVKAWGCAKMHENFGNVVPPYGCSDATGTGWI